MAIPLRQSTASQEIPLGYFLDSTDGNTEETGLTVANTDIKLWKHGATTLANKNSGGATHISNGIYYAVLDATDTNTLGGLVIFVHVSGALAIRVECVVLAANVYDALIAGTDKLQTDAVEISSDSAAADALELLVENAKGTDHKVLVSTDAQDLSATLDVNTKTLESGLDLTATMKASVNSEADAALTDYDPPTKAEMDTGFAALNDPTAGSIADAVWDEASAGHTVAGSMGLALGSLNSTIVVRVAQCGDAGSDTTIDLDAASSAVNDFYKGQLIALVLGTGAGQARTCTGYDGATRIATVTPAWATNPDGNTYFAIVNTGSTVVVDWADDGRLDVLLDAIKAKTDNLPAAPADDTSIDSQLATIDTVVDAIKAKTDNLPADPADDSDIDAQLATIDTVVDAIKAKTDNLPADPADDSDIDTQLAAIQTQVNKIDGQATTVPGSATTGSLIDRVCNKDGSKTYSQATDSLEAIADTSGGDASAANQTTIINHLTDIKDGDGVDWDNTTDSLADIRAKVDTISGGTPVNVTHEHTVIQQGD